MQVLKFGGTSVANAENINKTVAIIQQALRNKNKTIVVVSALGGTTDMLIETGKMAVQQNELYKENLEAIEYRHLQVVRALIPIAQQSATLSLVKIRCNELESIFEGVFLLKELSLRTLDSIVSYGELLSSLIISARFEALQIDHQWIDSREIIRTDSNYGFASVNFLHTNTTVRQRLVESSHSLFILPGFIASNAEGITTTLGRGGSDYTAAILAASAKAGELQIWTDVSGMMTADPRLVCNAKPIPKISYGEAMELSHFGAKVIYPPTIQPVMSKRIPVMIKNTFAPDDCGTLIGANVSQNKTIVCGLSCTGKMALLSLEGSGMIGIPGFSKRFFEALAGKKINIVLITQSCSEHSICVAIDEVNTTLAKDAADAEFSYEISTNKIEPLKAENGLSIIAVVGDNMKNHPGISGKMFGTLGCNGVNVRAIAQGSSERNISAVIKTADVTKALNVLHEEFFETVVKQVNVFIAGSGNVGNRLIEQLNQQQFFLLEQLSIQVRVVGIANSKKMIVDENGIELDNWKEQLKNGTPMKLSAFASFIKQKNLRNSIFVDVTASEEVTECYGTLLKKSISVVACNKLGCSSSYKDYRQLKQLAREFNSSFLFETTVGAGLPVIGTLNDLIRSGDKINKIEAVLSGSLNFVFNNYNAESPFAQVIRQAQNEGYTEPDPRLDLSGIDVMRKILILAREAGYQMEMDEIKNNSFLPESSMEGHIPDFYRQLEKHEKHFQFLYQQAEQKDCKLKFVAKLENGKASVGLHHVSKENDLFHLYGKDNAVLFYTQRYPQQPLVIKGAGAGAEVTASGILADIIRAARI